MPLDENQIHAIKFQVQLYKSHNQLKLKSELFDFSNPNDKINFNLSHDGLMLLDVSKPIAYPHDPELWHLPITHQKFDRFRCFAAEFLNGPEIDAIISGATVYHTPNPDLFVPQRDAETGEAIYPAIFAFDEDFDPNPEQNQVVPQPSPKLQRPEIRKVIAIRATPPSNAADLLKENSPGNRNYDERNLRDFNDNNQK